MAEAPIIEMRNVTFEAQKIPIVRDFSHAFAEGRATALVGPSGCGKSTALKLAAGLLIPARGEVYFRGADISLMNRRETLSFRREGAVVFQDSALWANQNLDQILELPLRIHFPRMTAAERRERVREVLGEVGYRKALGIRPAMLSMGEQKLIAFARALLCRPRLLFLDEWTESLDDAAARRLVDLVRRRREAGDTLIFVTHEPQLIRELADFVVMILEGRLHVKLTREQLAADPALLSFVEREIGA